MRNVGVIKYDVEEVGLIQSQVNEIKSISLFSCMLYLPVVAIIRNYGYEVLCFRLLWGLVLLLFLSGQVFHLSVFSVSANFWQFGRM
jgi:hypothetical protein